LDVSGVDTAQKLAILSRLAFQTNVDPARIRVRGIDSLAEADIRYASELGYVVKLLALARSDDDQLHLRVAPTLVPKTYPMGQVRFEYNAIEVVGDATGDLFYSGKGAGRMPTASAVAACLVDLAVGRGQPTFKAARLWEHDAHGPRFVADSSMRSRFYLRFTISDQPGTLAMIAGILGRHGISIASVVQHESTGGSVGSGVPLLIMTHMADEQAVERALAETDALEIIHEPSVCLHVAD
ncbi:MAG: homoserine dehydrogenase, partial [Planctomycetia bacterium]